MSILLGIFLLQDATLCSSSESSKQTAERGRAAFERLRTIKFLPIKRGQRKVYGSGCCHQQRKELADFLSHIEHLLLSDLGGLPIQHNYYDSPVADMYRVSAYYLLKNLLYDKGKAEINGGYKQYEEAKKAGWTDNLLIKLESDIIDHLRAGNKIPPWGKTNKGFATKTKRFISKSQYNLSKKTVETLMPAYAQYFEKEEDLMVDHPSAPQQQIEEIPITDMLEGSTDDLVSPNYNEFKLLGALIFAGSGWLLFGLDKMAKVSKQAPPKQAT